MIYYLKGKIKYKSFESVIIDVNNIGYQVYLSNVDLFKYNEDCLIYTYEIIREDDRYLVGFKTFDERKLFLTLIKVQGIGPKTALTMLKHESPQNIIAAISANNISFLRQIPGIGTKVAAQILLDLRGVFNSSKTDPDLYDQVKMALKNLGFKSNAIEKVIATINIPGASKEEIIKIALTKLGK